jgi:hypothetical protein
MAKRNNMIIFLTTSAFIEVEHIRTAAVWQTDHP